MQDRYAGDVGDFGKFALLRALSPGRKLGVCWYRFDGSLETSNDGRHVAYLDRPDRFRDLDPDLFDCLSTYLARVREGGASRSVAELERLALLDGATRYHSDYRPPAHSTRSAWFKKLVETMSESDLLFLDPDNGIEGYRPSAKSASVEELVALRKPERALLVYHHQSRLKGGAPAEFASIRLRLLAAGFDHVEAVRLRPYSSRFYFLLDGDSELTRRLADFALLWDSRAQLFRGADALERTQRGARAD